MSNLYVAKAAQIILRAIESQGGVFSANPFCSSIAILRDSLEPEAVDPSLVLDIEDVPIFDFFRSNTVAFETIWAKALLGIKGYWYQQHPQSTDFSDQNWPFPTAFTSQTTTGTLIGRICIGWEISEQQLRLLDLRPM